MRDEFRRERLPDLPTAGYDTRKERATTDMVMFWLRAVERNRMLLLMIVIDGIDKWRKSAGKAWHLNRAGRSTAFSKELLDRIFDYMTILAGPNPAQQLLILESQLHQQARRQWDFRPNALNELRKVEAQVRADIIRGERQPRRVYSR